ncbi:MAG: glycosyl hydrolase family 18 protein [Planctomycetota bacterium]|jgi:spore germination protein YaaH
MQRLLTALFAFLVSAFLLGGCGEEIATLYVEDPALAPAATGDVTATPSNPSAPTGPAIRVSGWHPSWAGSAGDQTIANAGSAMDEINPTWYSLNADGTLKRSGEARNEADQRAYVADMHARGYEVIPMVDDFQSGNPSRSVMDSAQLRAANIANLLHEVDTFDLDGVDIDYERMQSSDRAGFSAFMTDLGAQLHAREKVLTVAVWSKTSEPGSGVSGSQDWALLGQVVDRFKIMTYGWGWSGGPARAIGPVWRAEGILQFAMSQMPAEKVYFAIPFYGYRWPDNGGRGKSVTYNGAMSLANRHGKTPVFDAHEGESTFTYTDADGVSWEVWFATDQAIEAKFQLARRLGIGGVAIWRLGGDPASFWEVIRRERQ